MSHLRASLVALFASVALFTSACAAPATTGEEEGSTDSALTHGHDQHAPLSKDLLCAAVAAADEQNGDLVGIDESDLKGDARRDFKEFQKGMANDFPSAAYKMPVKLGSKTFDFILVVETNDGGGQMGIYRTDGSTVATESSGESDPFTWSSPADKCE
jgi:hypothetical protein